VRLVGVESPASGIGARVVLTAGEKKWMREAGASAGYLSTNDPRLHFGLGQQKSVDRLEVHWPSGVVQLLTDVGVDRIVTVKEEATPSEAAGAEPSAEPGAAKGAAAK